MVDHAKNSQTMMFRRVSLSSPAWHMSQCLVQRSFCVCMAVYNAHHMECELRHGIVCGLLPRRLIFQGIKWEYWLAKKRERDKSPGFILCRGGAETTLVLSSRTAFLARKVR